MREDVMRVFERWQQIMKKPKAKLGPVRQKAIERCLASGFSFEEIEQAIWGCKLSEFHDGKNENGTKYQDIELICRNELKTEFFISIYEEEKKKADLKKQKEAERKLFEERVKINLNNGNI